MFHVIKTKFHDRDMPTLFGELSIDHLNEVHMPRGIGHKPDMEAQTLSTGGGV